MPNNRIAVLCRDNQIRVVETTERERHGDPRWYATLLDKPRKGAKGAQPVSTYGTLRWSAIDRQYHFHEVKSA